MRRPLMVALVAGGLLIGLGGLYFYLSHPAAAPGAAPVSAASVYATAVANVPAPVLPPQPAGAEVKKVRRRLQLRLPPAAPGSEEPAPPVTQDVPQITGTTQEDSDWQNQVNAKQAAYEQALQTEVDNLVKQQQASAAPAGDWVTTTLVPLIAAVKGKAGG